MPNSFSINARPIALLMCAAGVWLLAVQLVLFVDGFFRSWIITKSVQENGEVSLFGTPLGLANVWIAPILAAIVTGIALSIIFENFNTSMIALTGLLLATVSWGQFGFHFRMGPVVTSLIVGILIPATLLTASRLTGRHTRNSG